MMKLIEPSEEYSTKIKAYREEYLAFGGSMDGTGKLRKMADPKEWIQYCRLCKDPATVPQGLVPATQYLYVREEDDKIVGMIQIRHYLNEYLGKYGGHIGYSVVPSERRKGYASKMLKEVLPICKKLGIEKVLITCIDSNEASRRTIQANGGVYESTVYEPDEKVYLERYWIDLAEKQ
ncbi:MAG: GNAT family N-acetyltransferase [Erysipelotrichaceae bacterium]|nr:GNAT family N-acetyltransferase [Erysipelotrichaceae bacterium]